MENQLLVAVWMVAYNHVDFIENAIESVMMQECTFQYKLFIGEDNSTDKTREICQKFKEKYADKIELFLHEENIGSTSNGLFMYEKCFDSNAKYIALCEGDDYWTDPLKLQKQVDFLEENEDFHAITHDCQILYENDETQNYIFRGKLILDIKEIIRIGIPAATNSLLFKKEILEDLNYINNEYYYQYGETPCFGDVTLYISILFNGKIYNIGETMSVYRRHNNGISSSHKFLNVYKKHYINILNIINLITDRKYNNTVKNRIKYLIQEEEQKSNFLLRKIKFILLRLRNKFS